MGANCARHMTHMHKPHVPKNQPCFQTASPRDPPFPPFPLLHATRPNTVYENEECMQKLHLQSPRMDTFGVSMERGPELSAVLWTVLILCIILIVYLSFVPEDRQQKDKEAADAFTATVIPSFKKKPDDKKET